MAWLLAQMWAFLFAAFAAGVAVGAWAFSARRRTSAAPGGRKPRRGVRPAAPLNLFASAPNDPDDLTQVIGIDPQTAARLNALGVYQFRQIARWDEASVRWIEKQIDAEDRVVRERWVEQAALLA